MIDGNKIAQEIITALKTRPIPKRSLAAILIGDNPASLSFIKQKEKAARALGIDFRVYQFLAFMSQKEIEEEVEKLCRYEEIGGIILQLPLPEKYNRAPVIERLDPRKDIDNLTGKATVLAPAVRALRRILHDYQFPLEEATVAVVGLGFLIGAPAVRWLTGRAKNIITLDKNRFDPDQLKNADLVVAGTGVPGIIRGSFLKRNAMVVDFGYGKVGNQLVGDVDIESVLPVTQFITPTPGGTGPVVVAELLHNFFDLAS